MLTTRKHSRSVIVVYVLVLCAFTIAFITITHGNDIPDSVKDLALRGGRAQQHTFATHVNNKLANIDIEALKQVAGNETGGDRAVPAESRSEGNQVPLSLASTRASVRSSADLLREDILREDAVHSPAEEVADATMPVPRGMLLPFEKINLDAITPNIDRESEHTEFPTVTPIVIAIDTDPLTPLTLSIPLVDVKGSYGDEGWVTLDDLYDAYWSATQSSSEHSDQGQDIRPKRGEQSVDMLNNFHSALKYGQICSDGALRDLRRNPTSASARYHSSISEDAVDSHDFIRRAAMKEVMRAKSRLFIEFSKVATTEEGSSAASFSVSSYHPSTISVLFQSFSPPHAPVSSSPKPPCAMDRFPDIRHPPSNVFVAQSPHSDSSSNRQWHKSLNCVQLVTSFDAIFTSESDPLPFDMEDALGWTLCRCNVTLLPSRLPTNSFYSYWEDVDMLVAEAVAATKGACAVTVNTSSMHDSSHSSSPPYSSRSGSSSLSSASSSIHSSGVTSAKYVYVYRQDSSVTAQSPLPVSTLMSTQLEPSSRTRLMSSIAMTYVPKMSRVAVSAQAILDDMLSLDLSCHHPDHWGSAMSDSSGVGSKSDRIAESGAHSLYARGRRSPYSSHSEYTGYRTSGSKYGESSTSISPPLVALPGTDTEAGAKKSSPMTQDGNISATAEASSHKDEPQSNPEPVLPSTIGNGSDLGDAANVPSSGRKLLTYPYTPGGASSISTSGSSPIHGLSSSSSTLSATKSSSYRSSSSNPSSSLSTSNSSSSSANAQPSSVVSPFREPAKKRLHPLPAMSYSFWSPSPGSARLPEMRSTEDELDQWIHAQVVNKERYPTVASESVHSSGMTTKSSVEQLSWTSRLQQKALRGREDRVHYQRWLRLLKGREEFRGVVRRNRQSLSSAQTYPLIYIFGRCATMLSVRVAQMLASPLSRQRDVVGPASAGLVLTLQTDSQSWEPHRELLDTLGLQNNIISYQKLSVPLVTALAASPELANVLILQGDIFVEVAHAALLQMERSDLFPEQDKCLAGLVLFEDLVASLLSLAEHVYIEIPDVNIIHAVFYALSKECFDVVSARYDHTANVLRRITARVQIPESMSRYQCTKAEVGDVDPDNGSPELSPEYCLHVDIAEVNESIAADGVEGSHVNKSMTSSIYHVNVRLSDGVVQQGSAEHSPDDSGSIGFGRSKLMHHGVSLYTLLHFNVEPALKRSLFKLFLEIPFHMLDSFEQQLVLPSNVFAKVLVNPAESRPHARFVDLSLVHPPEEMTELLSTGALHENGAPPTHSSAVQWTISSATGEIATARSAADTYWHALRREMHSHPSEVAAEGRFSFVEHNSDFGFVSYQLAKEFSNATVVSLESDKHKAAQHVKMVKDLNVENNVVCNKVTESDSAIFKNIYESPELFRYQLIARGVLEAFGEATNLESWGRDLGSVLSSALTTFIAVPSSAQVSLAMSVLMGNSGTELSGPFRPLSLMYGHRGGEAVGAREDTNWSRTASISNHPLSEYRGFETIWLLGSSRVDGGSTQVALTPIYHDTKSTLPILIRCDIVNMTRHVHHHYNYAKDGHTRTYTMRVEVNSSETQLASLSVGDVSSAAPLRADEAILLQGQDISHQYTLPLGMHPNQHQVVWVRLYRDKDSFPIPYTSIYGITLISILRLGLDSGQRERLFSSFLNLPLYEDMAPWNMVLMGKDMAYIDYDTRDMTFDADVPKAYQVMSVLMNYKRTVEDFKRCGGKAPTVYGIAFISDCIGSNTVVKCPNLKLPVPCGDGHCHSDYISCLRALSEQAEIFISDGSRHDGAVGNDPEDVLSRAIVEAMRSGIGSFDELGFSYKQGVQK